MDGEFVEVTAAEELDAFDVLQPFFQGQSRGVVQFRQPGQAGFTQEGHVDGERQGAQAGIGADVAGGLFPADVLFAGGQGQHEAATAIRIQGLTSKAPRHLTHEFVAGGKQPQARAAE